MRPPPQKCDPEVGPAAKCEVLLVEVQEIVEGLQKARSSELALPRIRTCGEPSCVIEALCPCGPLRHLQPTIADSGSS